MWCYQSLGKCWEFNGLSRKYINVIGSYKLPFKRSFVLHSTENKINSFEQCLENNWFNLNPRGKAYQHLLHQKMEKVYFRHKPCAEVVTICFRYTNDKFAVNREFNFCRKVVENIDLALSRMRANIARELIKKHSKAKKKGYDNQNELTHIKNMNLEFREGTNKLSNITLAELIKDHACDQLQLHIDDLVYKVVINVPWVVSLELPITAMAGFVIFPTKLELQFADRPSCKVVWCKAKSSEDGSLLSNTDWIPCGHDYMYESTNDDVGYYIKLLFTPKNAEGIEGPTVELVMKNALQPSPGPRPYEERALLYTSEPLLNSNEFRVVSYNLLADLYADSDYSRTQLYPYCPPYALKFDYRKQLYLHEIKSYNSDIVCLQEVDLKLFNCELQSILENSSQELIGLMAQKGKTAEGIATFYNRKKFDYIESHTINIGNAMSMLVFRPIYEHIQNNVNLMQRLSARSTTLQVTLLKLKDTSTADGFISTNTSCESTSGDKLPARYLLVVNTHLYYHPDADHIRLLQMGFAMLFLEDFYSCLKKKYFKNDSIAIIFCGDFNSTPDCGIYRLMTQQFVPSNIPDWSSNKDEAVKNLALLQPFIFRSAYDTSVNTNFTPLFSGCLDYIYYQYDLLSVKQVVPLPTVEELTSHIAIPSVVFPSDHLSLVADFIYK